MGEKWEIVTPGPPMVGMYGMPGGEGTIGAKRISTKKSPNKQKPKTRWTRTKRVLGLIPWGAIISCAFLLTGLIIFLVHAKSAAQKSSQMLTLAQSNTNGQYPHRVAVFSGSYVVTAGLASGCILASAWLAFARLRQKLAIEKNDRWGGFKYGVFFYVGILAFCSILLPTLWFIINCIYLSAWGMALYTLRDALTPAITFLQHSDMSSIKQSAPLPATNGICPAAGCFNLNYYVWLDSTYCLCTTQLLQEMEDITSGAVYCVVWAMSGAACMVFGALLAGVQGGADLALLKCEHRHVAELEKAKKPSSPAKRAPLDEYSTPGTALPKRNLYHAGGVPAAYYIQSPAPAMGYV